MCGDQVEDRACNVDLPRPHICMLCNEQNVQAREARRKRQIVADLFEISITENHRREPRDDYVSFDNTKEDLNPYPRVL